MQEMFILQESLKRISEKYIKSSLFWVNSETGETYATEEEKNKALSKEYDLEIYIRMQESKELAKQLESNYDTSTRMISKNSKKTKKQDRLFNIIDKKYFDEVMTNMKLSVMDRYILMMIHGIAAYPENDVAINGKTPSLAELAKYMDLSSKTLVASLKKLEEHNLVKREQDGHRKKIYLNPSLGGSSAKTDNISDTTLHMFGLS